MQPSHVKFLLLILAMLGAVGGYYFITTAPATTVKTDQKVEVQPTKTNAVNVSNVRIEQTAGGVMVTGQAKDMIDPGYSFFQINAPGVIPSPTLQALTADMLIENGKLRSGMVQATLKTGDKTDVAHIKITRVNTIGNGGTMLATIIMREVSKEVTIPFTRDGNTIAGDVPLDFAALGFTDADLKKNIRFTWRLGIK